MKTTLKEYKFVNDCNVYGLIADVVLFTIYTVYFAKTIRGFKYLIAPAMKKILIGFEVLLSIRIVIFICVTGWYLLTV